MHYRDLIARLGLTQVSAGRFLGIDERTSRRWAHPDAPEDAPPLAIRMLLRLMLRYNATVEEVNHMMGRPDDPQK